MDSTSAVFGPTVAASQRSKGGKMVHDSEYCRRRAAEARAAACRKDDVERTAMEGQLALAYASLARFRREVTVEAASIEPVA